jgi:hypothetical protein
MPSYDDDLPTKHEEYLLQQLDKHENEHERICAMIEVGRPI